jgi:hypothetical protein
MRAMLFRESSVPRFDDAGRAGQGERPVAGRAQIPVPRCRTNGTRAGEKFTRIEITMFVGRSREAKRALHREIVRRLTPFGVPAEDVKIVLVEVPTENVGIRGGQAACDVDLGYVLSV